MPLDWHPISKKPEPFKTVWLYLDGGAAPEGYFHPQGSWFSLGRKGPQGLESAAVEIDVAFILAWAYIEAPDKVALLLEAGDNRDTAALVASLTPDEAAKWAQWQRAAAGRRVTS